jgi:hypothetical protein
MWSTCFRWSSLDDPGLEQSDERSWPRAGGNSNPPPKFENRHPNPEKPISAGPRLFRRSYLAPSRQILPRNRKTPAEQGFCVERVTGIEPAWPAWKAGTLPLSYTRKGYFWLLDQPKPVNVQRANVRWSGRQDLNLRPPAPKAGALPSCATPRKPTN